MLCEQNSELLKVTRHKKRAANFDSEDEAPYLLTEV